MSEKILFTDMDGTLLTSQKTVSQPLAGLISQMIASGHRFVLSSGRTLTSILSCAQKAGLLYPDTLIIAVNGNLVYDCKSRRALMEKTVPEPVCRDIIEMARGYGLHIQSYDESRVVCEKAGPELSFYQKSTGLEAVLTDDIMGCIGRAPHKLLAIDLNGRDRLLALQQDILSRYGDIVTAIFSCNQYLEVFDKTAGKGNALRFVCRHLGIPVSRSVAAGDAENDISMLDAAGTAVAMANAPEEVKAHADFVTRQDNDHDGLGEAVRAFFLSPDPGQTVANR